MPELPEVETTRRGIEPHLHRATIAAFHVYDARLRWPVDPQLSTLLPGARIDSIERRAKYLLLRTARGTLILHLGMSGNLRVLPMATPRLKHDHFDLVLTNGQTLRFNDPRRFGSAVFTTGDPLQHKLLQKLAPEPLEPAFTPAYLQSVSRGKRVSIKQLLLNGQLVTGVGNIYASEALYRAGIRPKRAAGRIKPDEIKKLVNAVRAVLKMAIRAGGTTLRDYVNPEGNAGYFKQKLYVYERAGLPCRVCKTPIRKLTQGQRSTYWCPTCQH